MCLQEIHLSRLEHVQLLEGLLVTPFQWGGHTTSTYIFRLVPITLSRRCLFPIFLALLSRVAQAADSLT